TTSVWPDSTIPPSTFGPIVAKRLALSPSGLGTMRLSTPWLDSHGRQNAMMSRLLVVETLGKATRCASISRGEWDMNASFLERSAHLRAAGAAGSRAPERNL